MNREPAATSFTTSARVWVERVLRWYGTVLFSPRPVVGALLAMGTLAAPDHGLCGLVCALLAWFISGLLDIPDAEREAGSASINALLFGLLIGSRFSGVMTLAGFCVLGAFAICLVTRGFQNSVGHFGKVPTCSYPFVLTTILLTYVARAQEHRWGFEVFTAVPATATWVESFIYQPLHLTVIEKLAREVLLFGSSLGAIFFQHHAWAGLLIGIALLVSSRAAFTLAALGFMGMRLTCQALPLACYDPDPTLGFNAILIAIAIGGYFFVPGRRTLLLMFLCQTVGIFVGLACAAVGRFSGAECTALPFNLVVSATILALHARFPGARPCQPSLLFADPEEAYAYHQRYHDRMTMAAIGVPVCGRWQIVQGFDGPETHREWWRFGVDLAAVDESGRRCRGASASVDDHYTWQAVVRSPVDGIVAEIRDLVPDNPLGDMNLKDLWGNYVTIYSAGVYVGLYHLKHGSISVTPGQAIAMGAPIGRAGNSGRSALPHLHLQVQAVPAGGAANLPFMLRDVLLSDGVDDEYRPFFKPEAGAIITEFAAGDDLRGFFLPAHGEVWQLRVEHAPSRSGTARWTFLWQLSGTVVISDDSGDWLEYRLNARSIEVLRFPERVGTPLHLLGLAIADLPYHCAGGLSWQATLYGRSATPLLAPQRRFLATLVGDLLSTNLKKRYLDPVYETGKDVLHGVEVAFARPEDGGLLCGSNIVLRLSPNRSMRLEWQRGGTMILKCARDVGAEAL